MQQIASLTDRSTVPAAKRRRRRRALYFWLTMIGVFTIALAFFDMVSR